MRGGNRESITAALLASGMIFLHIGAAFAANRWGADYFPNVPLITYDGASVRLYDDLLKGKSVAFNVMSMCLMDECAVTTALVAFHQQGTCCVQDEDYCI